MSVETATPGFKNLDLLRYRDPNNRAELPRELWSLLTEMEAMKGDGGRVTLREMVWVAGKGFFHNVEGEWILYRDYFGKAIGETKDVRAKERFGAELLGWERAEGIVADEPEKNLLVLSPPGETYRFADMKPLTATFILLRDKDSAVEVDGIKTEGTSFFAYSLYVDEIPVDKHLAIARGVAEIANPDWLKNLDINNPLIIVALPWLLNKKIEDLDKLSQGLGFDGWYQVELIATDLRKKKKDVERGFEKRGALIQLLCEVVDRALKGDEWDPEASSMAIKRVLAKEAMDKYLDMDSESIRKDVLNTVTHQHELSGKSIRNLSYVDPWEYYSWRNQEQMMMHNVMFRRMLSAHGGGGLNFGKDNNPFIDMRTNMFLKREKKQEKITCTNCKKEVGKDKSTCPNCGTTVSAGGA